MAQTAALSCTARLSTSGKQYRGPSRSSACPRIACVSQLISSYVADHQLGSVKITRLEKHVSRDIVRVAMSGYNSDISLAALDCGAPPDVPFAYIPEALGSSIYGSRVTYHCVFDYWFARDVYEHVITCDESGEWSDVPINGCRSTFS